MKSMLTLLLLFFTILVSYGQSGQKLSRGESATMTQEQRIVHESNRKTKGGKKKKKMSMKKRVKMDKKQDKKARRVKSPKPRSGNSRSK
jgi:hypothetical protein